MENVTVENGNLVWQDQQSLGFADNEFQDVVITSEIGFQDDLILIPRLYESHVYLGVRFERKEDTLMEVSFFSNHFGEQHQLESKVLEYVSPFTFKAIITGTSYEILMNDTPLFHIEYSGLKRGGFAVLGFEGTVLTSVQIESVFPDGWESNVDNVKEAFVSVRENKNLDYYLYAFNPNAKDKLHLKQSFQVDTQEHTLSFYSFGEWTIEIRELNGTSLNTHSLNKTSEDWAFHRQTVSLDELCTAVEVRFIPKDHVPCGINHLQLEPLPFFTTYIQNDEIDNATSRNNSLITYPVKKLFPLQEGTITMWVRPSVSYNQTDMETTFWSLDEKVVLYYDGSNIVLSYFDQIISQPYNLTTEKWTLLKISWGKEGLFLQVDNTINGNEEDYVSSYSYDLLTIGSGLKGTFQGIVDDFVIYQKQISLDEGILLYESEDKPENDPHMVMRGTFNNAIGNFNQNVIDLTMKPNYGSPIIVSYLDGTPLRKVSFFDPETGEYRTYHEEPVTYNRHYDYLEISYSDILEDEYNITVRDEQGVIHGDPYQVSGRQIYMYLTEEEKIQLHRKDLYVMYQLKDAYTIDMNTNMVDRFSVGLGKSDGKPVQVTYEGNRAQDIQLADMIEMNPVLNPNNEGFLYVTNNVETSTSFKTKASPDSLLADGASESLITIEPVDALGNYIPDAQLEVKAEEGTLIPVLGLNALKSRERAGRYLYRYIAPLVSADDESRYLDKDQIYFRDKKSNLGSQIDVNLIVQPAYETARHGRTQEEKHLDMIMSKISETIMQFWRQNVKSENSLEAILDINNDGKINEQELLYLENNRHRQVLFGWYQAIKTWQEEQESD